MKVKIRNYRIRKKHVKVSTLFFILAATSALHLVVDIITSGYIMPFYPLSNIQAGFNLFRLAPENLQGIIPATIDGILVLFWISWMEFKLKIRDYF